MPGRRSRSSNPMKEPKSGPTSRRAVGVRRAKSPVAELFLTEPKAYEGRLARNRRARVVLEDMQLIALLGAVFRLD